LTVRRLSAIATGEDAAAVTDDSGLVRRIQQGDRQAFGELLDRYEARVYRLALSYTGSVADAEDVTQEVFLGIHRNLGQFRGRAALSTWIYRVAVNHCLEFRRKRRLPSVSLDEGAEIPSVRWEDDPVQVATKVSLKEEVARAMAGLTDVQREVVEMHELHGLTYSECADVLGIPVGTVKSRLANAFVRLRETLRVGCEEA
jgi:RNA polymerase sigma-70 factor, ECF subfamily